MAVVSTSKHIELVSIRLPKPPPADEREGKGEKGAVELGPSLEANEQSSELVQPGEGALDDPAIATQAGSVRILATGDLWSDAAPPELAATPPGVIAAISEELRGSPSGPTHLPRHGRDRIEQGKKFGDVVSVSTCDRDREREPGLIDDQVVLGAQPSTVNRARARLGAPFFACT